MRTDLRKLALLCTQTFGMSLALSLPALAMYAGPDDVARLASGTKRYEAANYAEAQKDFEAYLVKNSDDYKAHYFNANALVKLGRLNEAADEYKEVLSLDPDKNTSDYSIQAFNKISVQLQEMQARQKGYTVSNATNIAPSSKQQTPVRQPIANSQSGANNIIAPGYGNLNRTAAIPYSNSSGNLNKSNNINQNNLNQNNPYSNSSNLNNSNYSRHGMHGGGYGSRYSGGRSDDLLPSSLTSSGAKVTPTVGPSDSSGGYSGNNLPNQFGGGPGGSGLGFGGFPAGNAFNGRSAPQTTNWTQNNASAHAPVTEKDQMRSSVQSASAQTAELKRINAQQENQEMMQIQQERTDDWYGKQRRMNAVHDMYQKKQQALEEAATNFDARYASARPQDKVRLSPLHNDLHVQNFEITDTPSGDAVPMMANQKKLTDVPVAKTANAASGSSTKKQKSGN